MRFVHTTRLCKKERMPVFMEEDLRLKVVFCHKVTIVSSKSLILCSINDSESTIIQILKTNLVIIEFIKWGREGRSFKSTKINGKNRN